MSVLQRATSGPRRLLSLPAATAVLLVVFLVATSTVTRGRGNANTALASTAHEAKSTGDGALVGGLVASRSVPARYLISTTTSDAPSMVPSDAPSMVPSDAPSMVPSDAPSAVPTILSPSLSQLPTVPSEGDETVPPPQTTDACTSGVIKVWVSRRTNAAKTRARTAPRRLANNTETCLPRRYRIEAQSSCTTTTAANSTNIPARAVRLVHVESGKVVQRSLARPKVPHLLLLGGDAAAPTAPAKGPGLPIERLPNGKYYVGSGGRRIYFTQMCPP